MLSPTSSSAAAALGAPSASTAAAPPPTPIESRQSSLARAGSGQAPRGLPEWALPRPGSFEVPSPRRRTDLANLLLEGRAMPSGYEACSPVYGFLWTQTRVAEHFYRFFPPDSAIGRLMHMLFYCTEGVEFSPTRHVARAATYLAPGTLGRLAALVACGEGRRETFAATLEDCTEMAKRRMHARSRFLLLEQLVDIAIGCFEERVEQQRVLEGEIAERKEEKQRATQALGQLRYQAQRELSVSRREALGEVERALETLRDAKPGGRQIVSPNRQRAAWRGYNSDKEALEARRRAIIDADIRSKPELLEAVRRAEARLDAITHTITQTRARARRNKTGFREQVAACVEARGLSMAPLDALSQLDARGPRLPDKLRNALAQRDPGSDETFRRGRSRLVDALCAAVAAHREDPSIVTRALTALLWRAHRDEGALRLYARGVSMVAHTYPRPRRHPPPCARRVLTRHQEMVAGGFFPPMCSTAVVRASDDSALFPDCGESSVRNFFNVLLHQSGRFDATRLEHPELTAHPHLLEFYRTHDLASEVTSQAAHNDWAYVTAHKNRPGAPPIRYLSPARASTCEIDAGGQNVLALLTALVGTADVAHIVRCLSSGAEVPAVCDLTHFSPDDRTCATGPNEIVLHFGAHTFEWSFLPRHYLCRVLGPDQEREAEAKEALLAELRETLAARSLPPGGISEYVLGLHTAGVREVMGSLEDAGLCATGVAELVFASNLRTVDALYHAILELLDAPRFRREPFLGACLAGMALALPRHPDHLPKRQHIADLIEARELPHLRDATRALREMTSASWVDTRAVPGP